MLPRSTGAGLRNRGDRHRQWSIGCRWAAKTCFLAPDNKIGNRARAVLGNSRIKGGFRSSGTTQIDALSTSVQGQELYGIFASWDAQLPVGIACCLFLEARILGISELIAEWASVHENRCLWTFDQFHLGQWSCNSLARIMPGSGTPRPQRGVLRT